MQYLSVISVRGEISSWTNHLEVVMGKFSKQLNGGVVAHMKNYQTVDVVSQASLTSLRDETENSLKAVLVVVTGFHGI